MGPPHTIQTDGWIWTQITGHNRKVSSFRSQMTCFESVFSPCISVNNEQGGVVRCVMTDSGVTNGEVRMEKLRQPICLFI